MIKVIELRKYMQPDGDLVPVEFNGEIPFVPKRIFYISNVPFGVMRGGHAHKQCEQLVIPITGSFVLNAKRFEEGKLKFFERTMTCQNEAAYIPAQTWLTLTRFTPNTICLVLASHPYDTEDYLNDFESFEVFANPIQQPGACFGSVEGESQSGNSIRLG